MRIWTPGVFLSGFLFLVAGFGQAKAAETGPSFSCAHPSALETIICKDKGLSQQDRDLARLYARSKIDLFNTGPSGQGALQKTWLANRNRDCVDTRYGPSDTCLSNAYRARLGELAVATLFRDPDDALAVLKREYPKLAPLYAALYHYVTIRDDARRRQVVGALVENAQGQSDDENVKSLTPEEVVASDKGFSAYFIVADMAAGDIMPMPCDALLRRPALIEALGAYYGGMLDSMVPDSDCDAMLPPVPELETFADHAWQDVGDCDGTIRFSVFRDSQKTLTVVRLHRDDIWKDSLSEDLPPKRAAAGAVAVKALTGYYIRAYRLAPEVAAVDAQTAIGALSASIYNGCGE
jgi:uncharacterized protein